MSGLVQQLLPEMVGLVVTPAAIIAALLLLDSTRPIRNVGLFAVGFLAPYAVISVLAVSIGAAAGSSGHSDVRHWIGLVVGVLFLVGAGVMIARGRHRERGVAEQPPAWARRLQDPGTGTVLIAGVALAAINPNLAILASGLGTVTTVAVTTGQRVVGVCCLLAASLLDFALPLAAYAVAGDGGRARLSRAKQWLIGHEQVIGIVVLAVFGVLFTVRAVAALL